VSHPCRGCRRSICPTPPERPPCPLQNWLRFADNKLGGTIPASWAATSPHLSQLTLDENVPGFSGNLYMLAQHSMINFNAANNPQMVRQWGTSVWWAGE
jgi:hypothetical protein